ncbi:hypothetical protein [Streptomyces katsurahamanus]|uniref:Uncharacterized protein n=1 Tax=Streptomyces katsurahamanus TaxID=2577098 RepID=A0ABW9NY08_9ACTN|nr:hypothetical protein [Streptomyces katsurahamanus]MQS38211.1 hypothetical protein [Streptomyces katsurahamanus]
MSEATTGTRTRRHDHRVWTSGICWLYCRQTGPVLWLGSVAAAGLETGIYGCEMCIAELEHMVRVAVTERDSRNGYAPTG